MFVRVARLHQDLHVNVERCKTISFKIISGVTTQKPSEQNYNYIFCGCLNIISIHAKCTNYWI